MIMHFDNIRSNKVHPLKSSDKKLIVINGQKKTTSVSVEEFTFMAMPHLLEKAYVMIGITMQSN